MKYIIPILFLFASCKSKPKEVLRIQENKPAAVDTISIYKSLGYNPFKTKWLLHFVDTAKITFRNKTVFDDEKQYQIYYKEYKIGIKHVLGKPFQSKEYWNVCILNRDGDIVICDDLTPSLNMSDSAKLIIINKLIK